LAGRLFSGSPVVEFMGVISKIRLSFCDSIADYAFTPEMARRIVIITRFAYQDAKVTHRLMLK